MPAKGWKFREAMADSIAEQWLANFNFLSACNEPPCLHHRSTGSRNESSLLAQAHDFRDLRPLYLPANGEASHVVKESLYTTSASELDRKKHQPIAVHLDEFAPQAERWRWGSERRHQQNRWKGTTRNPLGCARPSLGADFAPRWNQRFHSDCAAPKDN